MTIKRYPEDFKVEEILSPEAASLIRAEPRRLTLYRLSKRNLGTDEALERIASTLRVPLEEIGYAGLKDKHATTVQYISIGFPRSDAGRAPRRLEEGLWKIERIGWLEEPLSARSSIGNRFRVVVRDLTRRSSGELDERRALFSVPPSRGRTLRFVNYYGEQRFGSIRHGRGFAARHLVRGRFEEALRLLIAVPDRKDARGIKLAKTTIAAAWGDWKGLLETLPPCSERRVVEALVASGGDFRRGFSALPFFIQQITIEAYQSWLWNEIARRVIAGLCDPPFVTSATKFGDLLFPAAAGVSSDASSLAIPLLSPRMSLDEPWKRAAEDVLAIEGVSVRDLRVPGLRKPYFGALTRRLFAEASGFNLGPMERDESATGPGRFKRNLRFFLPRGSYGTVLLRALESKPRDLARSVQSIL